jgi:hypothetical protein
LAGKQRPSFLKRQKEQKRLARAAAKREQRQARKQEKAEHAGEPEGFAPEAAESAEVEGAGEEEDSRL